jgi:hypothetical protein
MDVVLPALRRSVSFLSASTHTRCAWTIEQHLFLVDRKECSAAYFRLRLSQRVSVHAQTEAASK